jgi:EAL domain-containing protein (putative c-di-GMP-specific phosphodiesterase class I)
MDFIKIDGSLIKDLDSDKSSRIIVESIEHIAKKSNIATVAEYVHSKEIFEMVKKLEIDCSQGYYLGEPKPYIEQ